MSFVWTWWFEVSVGTSRQWDRWWVWEPRASSGKRFGFRSPWSKLASGRWPLPQTLWWWSGCLHMNHPWPPEVELTCHLLLGPPQMTQSALWVAISVDPVLTMHLTLPLRKWSSARGRSRQLSPHCLMGLLPSQSWPCGQTHSLCENHPGRLQKQMQGRRNCLRKCKVLEEPGGKLHQHRLQPCPIAWLSSMLTHDLPISHCQSIESLRLCALLILLHSHTPFSPGWESPASSSQSARTHPSAHSTVTSSLKFSQSQDQSPYSGLPWCSGQPWIWYHLGHHPGWHVCIFVSPVKLWRPFSSFYGLVPSLGPGKKESNNYLLNVCMNKIIT